MYHALKGEKEEAIQNLQKAVGLEYNDLKFLESDDSMDVLREDIPFKELLEKVKIAAMVQSGHYGSLVFH